MMRLLQWLLVGHVHHWKEDDRHPVVIEHRDGSRVVAKDQGVRVFCTCTKCGRPKKFDLC